MRLDNNLQTLENIDIRVWINHPRRGDVMVEPVSPNGIKSILVWTMRQDWVPWMEVHDYQTLVRIVYDLGGIPTSSNLDLCVMQG